MVARDIALVRLTGAPVHFLHLSTAGSVDLVRRAKAEGLPVTAEAAPHHMLLTHAAGRRVRPGLQGQPAAAHRRGRRRGHGRLVRRHHRRGRHRSRARTRPRPRTSRSTRPHRACSGCRRRCRSPGRCSRRTSGPAQVFALLSAQPAAIARLTATDRRGGGHSPQGGPVEAGRDGQSLRLRPRRRRPWWIRARWPAGAATRPYAGRTFTGAVRHTVLRGEAVVIDATAQR